MRRTFTATAALLLAPALLSAKGDTIRIIITGGDLAAPIEITDPAIVIRYNVWAGAGTSSNESHGLNVDWSGGMVEPPKGLSIYDVAFVTTRQNPGIVLFVLTNLLWKGFLSLY